MSSKTIGQKSFSGRRNVWMLKYSGLQSTSESRWYQLFCNPIQLHANAWNCAAVNSLQVNNIKALGRIESERSPYNSTTANRGDTRRLHEVQSRVVSVLFAAAMHVPWMNCTHCFLSLKRWRSGRFCFLFIYLFTFNLQTECCVLQGGGQWRMVRRINKGRSGWRTNVPLPSAEKYLCDVRLVSGEEHKDLNWTCFQTDLYPKTTGNAHDEGLSTGQRAHCHVMAQKCRLLNVAGGRWNVDLRHITVASSLRITLQSLVVLNVKNLPSLICSAC